MCNLVLRTLTAKLYLAGVLNFKDDGNVTIERYKASEKGKSKIVLGVKKFREASMTSSID